MEKELSPQKNIKMVKVPTNGAGTFEGVNKMENNGSIVDKLLALNDESATESQVNEAEEGLFNKKWTLETAYKKFKKLSDKYGPSSHEAADFRWNRIHEDKIDPLDYEKEVLGKKPYWELATESAESGKEPSASKFKQEVYAKFLKSNDTGLAQFLADKVNIRFTSDPGVVGYIKPGDPNELVINKDLDFDKKVEVVRHELDHVMSGNNPEGNKVEKAEEAMGESIVDKILALGESSATENFEDEHIGKPSEDQEEMYGFEAIDSTYLDEFRTAVSDSLTTVGSLTTLQKLMDSEDISSDFRDELYFIKNTYDLSDTNSVLEGIYDKAETLLEDMEIQTLTELLDSDIGDDEVIEEDELGEYQEPEDWSTIDQEPIEEGEAINPEEGTEENTEENNEEF